MSSSLPNTPAGHAPVRTNAVVTWIADLAARLRVVDMRLVSGACALLTVWIVLGLISPRFLSADNMVNLTQQSAVIGFLALGVVLAMMIGQIDLSVGALSGLSSVVVAVTFMHTGLPLVVAVVLAILVGTLFGLAYGELATRFGLPGFVLTLAGLLIALGLQLVVLGRTGSVNLPFDTWLVHFAQQAYLPTALAVSLGGLGVAITAASMIHDRHRRGDAELTVASWRSIIVRIAFLAVVVLGSVLYLSTDRGVGWMFTLFVVLLCLVDVALRRTRWGRHVRAIGGNIESARRAGLPVRGITITVHILCSTFAAVGGVLAVGRLAAANQGTGGAETSLTVIAAALIGGASLYGGHGSAWSALVGVLVVQSISSGLTMMSVDVSVQYLIIGVVLVMAVAMDAGLQRRTGPLR